MLTLSAYAKINLTLEVIAKRDDGYHEITSILQTIDLADMLSFEPAERIEFACPYPGSNNVDLLQEPIQKAAYLLQSETGCTEGALIRLENVNIPRAAGLGSSSTGPATVLNGLNQLWALGLSRDELGAIASKIGSDTPFFIHGGTALAGGRGEKISLLPSPPKTWLVLLKPQIDPIPNKTASMYNSLKRHHFTSGELTQHLINELQQGNALHFQPLYNTFENTAYDFFAQLNEYRTRFLDAGAKSVHLAGAGPALFTLVENKSKGEALVNNLKGNGFEMYLTHTV
ncbi:MAG: 4-(cytidine 5'-diphospho)-2-C-methyl-D-erythritol kinase [Chloroflexi bacterium]|jgi:4-diphosphocytidyl-2-C-methyl-D-erythritol kinase|nr:4-(cytidine 5'-diphospho)-2-C-methyl-D-erythritol kinase [Chloroflexota bacterium]